MTAPTFILAATATEDGAYVFAQMRDGRIAWRAGFRVAGTSEVDGSGRFTDFDAAHRFPAELALDALVAASTNAMAGKSWLHSIRLVVA